MEKLNEQIKEQCHKAFYDIIRSDLEKSPPNTEHLATLINELADNLCKFIPSKKNIHKKIKEDIIQDEININTMSSIILGLINWIEKFQAPVYDKVTRKWKDDFKTAQNYNDFIIQFLQEYYLHIEKMYKEVFDARKRLINNDSIIPPEHRAKGNNGIPGIIKTGR